jgi:hypothetical protein
MSLPAAAASCAIPIEFAAAFAGTSELRRFPFGRLSFGPWKRRANEPAVHRAVVIRLPCRVLFGFVLDRGWRSFHLLDGFVCEGLFLERRVFHGRVDRRDLLGNVLDERLFLAARRRNAGLLVFVIRVAGRAASLLHLIVDHRHNGVIGDAAFTRTVIVQNVTEPRPALLH